MLGCSRRFDSRTIRAPMNRMMPADYTELQWDALVSGPPGSDAGQRSLVFFRIQLLGVFRIQSCPRTSLPNQSGKSGKFRTSPNADRRLPFSLPVGDAIQNDESEFHFFELEGAY